MSQILTEDEFTDRFTDLIRDYDLSPRCKEPLVLELSYGENEPVLTLSLKDAFQRYKEDPEKLESSLKPFIEDLGWTVQKPRYASKEVYELTLPVLRNFYTRPPVETEMGSDPACPKGPIVFEQVLKAPNEFLVLQFSLYKDEQYVPLRKGDVLPCMPDTSLIIRMALNNLALKTESAGLTATPLQFDNLRARSWLIGLNDEKLKPSIAALTCITQVMKSLQDTFNGENGLIGIIPSDDQLIVSIDTNDEAVVELGVLARQLIERTETPLSSFVWVFKDGNLEAVQALELQQATGGDVESQSTI